MMPSFQANNKPASQRNHVVVDKAAERENAGSVGFPLGCLRLCLLFVGAGPPKNKPVKCPRIGTIGSAVTSEILCES